MGGEQLDNHILVSVEMLTYNHEKYLNQALDSILMQKVNFKYEVVIGDDCSTDKTQSILKEYQSKYPDIIKPILREKNLGATKNDYDALNQCQGKYIALLEGDDYWCDVNKLQMQVDILEANPDYFGSAHSCNIYFQASGRVKNGGEFYYTKDHVYDFEDFRYNQFPGHAATLFFRNMFLDKTRDFSILYTAHTDASDRTLALLMVLEGKVFCIGKTMATYRFCRNQEEQNYSSRILNKNTCGIHFHYLMAMDEYSKKICNKSCLSQDIIDECIIRALEKYLSNSTKDNREIFNEIYQYKKHHYIYYYMATQNMRLIKALKRNGRKIISIIK